MFRFLPDKAGSVTLGGLTICIGFTGPFVGSELVNPVKLVPAGFLLFAREVRILSCTWREIDGKEEVTCVWVVVLGRTLGTFVFVTFAGGITLTILKVVGAPLRCPMVRLRMFGSCFTKRSFEFAVTVPAFSLSLTSSFNLKSLSIL